MLVSVESGAYATPISTIRYDTIEEFNVTISH